MLKLPNYVISRKLGRGSYGEVYLASRKSSDKLVAIKCIPKSKLNKRAQDNLISEISILQKLRHPHVVRLIDFSWDSDRVYLFMEYCAGGDLSHFIRSRRRLPEQLVRRFLRQLALALQYLKKKNIVHMDLKPQNILLTSSSNPVLKVTDFGFAQNCSETIKTNELRGTLLYMAPEIYCEGIYHPSCDLWSVGVILYECLFGSPPYASCDTQTLKAKLVQDQAIELPSTIPISADCAALLRGLLKRDPFDRLGHDEFFAHPFVDVKHAPSAESLDKALEFLEHALELEKIGNLKQAHDNYTRGLAHLVSAVEYETSPAERTELRQLAVRYFEQAEKVKKQLMHTRATSDWRPHRPPPPTSASRLEDRQDRLLVEEDSRNSNDAIIRATQVTVQGSPKPQHPFTGHASGSDGTTNAITEIHSSTALDVESSAQIQSRGSTSYFGGLFNGLRQLWIGGAEKLTTSEEYNQPNVRSPPNATGGAVTSDLETEATASEQTKSSSTCARPRRPPPPAYLETIKDLKNQSEQSRCKPKFRIPRGSRGSPEVTHQRTRLSATTLPSVLPDRPGSTFSRLGASTDSDVSDRLGSRPSVSMSVNLADRPLFDRSDTSSPRHEKRCSTISAEDDDDLESRDPSHASLVHSVPAAGPDPPSDLFHSVPSNLLRVGSQQITSSSTSFSHKSSSASGSRLESIVPDTQDGCVPEKLARLRQLSIRFTSKHGTFPRDSIERPAEQPLPEISAQQMTLLMDTERLCELESLCDATDKKMLNLLDHLKQFYALFRSDQYAEALQYFQSHFGTLLKIAKADTSEARRRAVMNELKLVLDLVESSQQQRKGQTASQSHSVQAVPTDPRSPSALILDKPDVGIEVTEDTVSPDECRLS